MGIAIRVMGVLFGSHVLPKNLPMLSLISEFAFGLGMAGYYAYGRHKHKLPLLKNFTV